MEENSKQNTGKNLPVDINDLYSYRNNIVKTFDNNLQFKMITEELIYYFLLEINSNTIGNDGCRKDSHMLSILLFLVHIVEYSTEKSKRLQSCKYYSYYKTLPTSFDELRSISRCIIIESRC